MFSLARMTLLEYTLLALSSLIVIVDPIATVPAFLAMTQHDTPAQRVRMARLASQSARSTRNSPPTRIATARTPRPAG